MKVVNIMVQVKMLLVWLPRCKVVSMFFVIYDRKWTSLDFRLLDNKQQPEDVTLGFMSIRHNFFFFFLHFINQRINSLLKVMWVSASVLSGLSTKLWWPCFRDVFTVHVCAFRCSSLCKYSEQTNLANPGDVSLDLLFRGTLSHCNPVSS